MTRLIYDALGIRFEHSALELELAFWRASRTILPEPHVEVALDALDARGIAAAVVSNTAFSGPAMEARRPR